MRYRLANDQALLSALLDHNLAAKKELLRRFAGRLVEISDTVLFLPPGERTQFLAAFFFQVEDWLLPDFTATQDLSLPLGRVLAARVLDFWPSYAKKSGLDPDMIAASLRKKQSDFLVSGLSLLASSINNLSTLDDEKQLDMRMRYAALASLRPRDLTVLAKANTDDAHLFTTLESLQPGQTAPDPSLLAGLIAEIRLEGLKRLVTREDQEHSLDFRLLQRFADCEHKRKLFFSSPAPAQYEPLAKQPVKGQRIHKQSRVPDMVEDSKIGEEAYFGRVDVILASERFFQLSLPPKKTCFNHYTLMAARQGRQDIRSLTKHAMRCTRCASIISISPLLTVSQTRRQNRKIHRELLAAMRELARTTQDNHD